MSSSSHAQIDVDGEGQPSHGAVSEKNQAVFKPKWLILDDINIDLLSILAAVSALVSVFGLGCQARAVAPAAAAVIVALRLLFPRPTAPQGTVLITGGSSGIGAELSYIFASKGHDLVLVGRDEEQLKAVKNNITDQYKRDVYTISLDLSVPGGAKKLYDHVKQQGLVIDVLVNDAALGAAGDTFDQPIELVERMTTLNCIALVQLTQLFGRDMMSRGRGGWILQLSSVVGAFPWAVSPSLFLLVLATQRKCVSERGANLILQAGCLVPVKISTMPRSISCAPSAKPSPSSSAHIRTWS